MGGPARWGAELPARLPQDARRATAGAALEEGRRALERPGRADRGLSLRMWTYCACGERHWGRYGAAGLLLTDPGRTGVVLQKRSRMVHYGGTWSVPGGGIEGLEDPVRAALREAHEEAGIVPEDVTVVESILGTDHGDWSYTYVLAEAVRPDDPRLGTSWEADRTAWVDLDRVSTRRLHPGLRADWPRLLVRPQQPDGRTA